MLCSGALKSGDGAKLRNVVIYFSEKIKEERLRMNVKNAKILTVRREGEEILGVVVEEWKWINHLDRNLTVERNYTRYITERITQY